MHQTAQDTFPFDPARYAISESASEFASNAGALHILHHRAPPRAFIANEIGDMVRAANDATSTVVNKAVVLM